VCWPIGNTMGHCITGKHFGAFEEWGLVVILEVKFSCLAYHIALINDNYKLIPCSLIKCMNVYYLDSRGVSFIMLMDSKNTTNVLYTKN
jgi:hypothetical protein